MDEIKTKIQVPDIMPKADNGDILLSIKELEIREKYINLGMFGFVSWKWIEPFVEWLGDRRCLEVMAGRGWWSYALQQKGVSVHATDNFSWHEQDQFHIMNDTLVNIEKLDAVDAVKKYGRDIEVLLISWPYMDDTAYAVLKTLHEVNPNAILAYIGEGNGGCTASDAFFEHFDEIEDFAFTDVEENYESWFGIRDRIRIGRYQTADDSEQ